MTQLRLRFVPEPTSSKSLPACDLAPAGQLSPTPSDSSPEFVRHPRARHYVIRVRPDGSVRVTIPRWGSKREAQAFAGRQHAWIERERRKVAEEQARFRCESDDPERIRALRASAAQELPPRLLELAAAHGLRVSRVSVRNQRWRWGSCSRDGHICLNWRLLAMPPWVRDYVMLHELMHLKRMDHSAKFWKLVEKVCPDYERARHWLRRQADWVTTRGGPIGGVDASGERLPAR